jgi:hypothetical protein
MHRPFILSRGVLVALLFFSWEDDALDAHLLRYLAIRAVLDIIDRFIRAGLGIGDGI